LAHDGVTVMVSSHLLGEIDRTANVLGILSGGRLIFQASRAEPLTASYPDLIITCSSPHAAIGVLGSYDTRLTETGEVTVSGVNDRQTARIVAELVGEGIEIYEVRREEQTLEDVFMRLTAGGGL